MNRIEKKRLDFAAYWKGIAAIALLVLCLLPNEVTAQGAYPGGLFGKDTSLTNWFRPEQASCTGFNCPVTSITARRGPNPTTVSGTVVHTLDGLNFNPSIQFTGGRMNFQRVTSPAPVWEDDVCIAVVIKTNDPTTGTGNWRVDPSILGADGLSGGNNNYAGVRMRAGDVGFGDDGGSGTYRHASSGTAYNDNRPHVIFINRRRCGGTCNTDGELFVDGVSKGRFNSRNVALNEFSTFVLGNTTGNPASAAFNGHYGDVILYADTLIALTERQRIETYAAIKYGITLNHNYHRLGGPLGTAPVYYLDAVFDNDVIGIARVDSARLYQRISQPAADPNGLYLMHGTGYGGAYPPTNDSISGSVMTNNQYLTMGHNGGTTTFNQPIGTANNVRMARTFKVAEVGNMSAVTIYFDYAKYNLIPGNAYYLALSNDAGFGVGERFYQLTDDANSGFYAEIDFPANDTVFFTITNQNNFAAPAAVAKGLELWLRGEVGIVGPTAAITSWRDRSGNNHHVATTGPNGAWPTAPANLNYHAYLSGATLDRDWGTSPFRGRTIIAVGRAQGGASQWDGYLGFNGDKGLRKTTNNATEEISPFNTDDWTMTPNSDFRQNGGAVVGTANILDFNILLGERDSLWTRQAFYLGDYFGGRTFSNYSFAEVMVYDTVLTLAEKLRVESYLALRYGMTLSHNYVNSSNTTVYSLTGFANEVAGIGRDDLGQFNQKQSRSVAGNSIVSLALVNHFNYDSLNTNAFTNDGQYLVTGHNGVAPTCWTDLDIRFPGEKGNHYRIQREWKAQKTGTWGADQVEFQLNVDVPGFNLPPLPSQSSAYYMYVDDDGNFTAGTRSKFAMNLASPGVWEVSVVPGALPDPFYFTFGTELDTLTKGTDTLCKGQPFLVIGSHLADSCTALTLIKTAAQYQSILGGVTADATFSIATNAAGNCLDTLRWRAPQVAVAGTYQLLVDTMPSAAGCALGAFSGIFNDRHGAQLKEIRIDTGEAALVTWPGPDTIYCANEPNFTPAKAVNCSPGFFEYANGPLVGNVGLIMPNSATGTILVHQGAIGTHTVRYVTNGGSACKDTASYTFTIKANSAPNIAYLPSSTFCAGSGLSQAATLTGQPSLGTYTSSPGLIFDDDSTGVIDLPASTPGIYVVTFNPAAGTCGNIDTTVVTISVPDRAFFNYPSPIYCRGAMDAVPLIQFTPTGGFALAPTSPGTVLTINPTTGAVDLTASASDTFHIHYAVTGSSCSFNALDTIIIRDTTVAAFALLPSDTFCLSDAAFQPSPATGYYTTATGGVYIGIDSLTIYPDSSTAGGPYILTHIQPDAFCPDTASLPIFFRGVAAASIIYSDTVVCANDPNPTPIFLSGSAGGSFLAGNGPVAQFVSAATGEVELDSMAAGSTYEVMYAAPDPACPDTFLVATIELNTVPNAHINLILDSICEGTGLYPIDTMPSTGNFSLTVFQGSNIVAGATTGSSIDSDVLQPGNTFLIQNIQSMPLTACADTAYDFLTVMEQDSADIQFIPNLICIGGNNPFPLIVGDGGGIFSLSVTAPYPVVVDPDSGIVFLLDSMVQDTYYVVYRTQGFCPSVDSAFLVIRGEQVADFDYADSKVCQTDTVLYSPVPGFLLGGAFTSNPAGLFFVDDSLGIFDPQQSLPGEYQVVYAMGSSTSCNSSFADRVTIVARDTSTTFDYVNSPYCPSDPDPTPVMTNSFAIQGLFSAPGLFFSNQDSGTIALASTPPDTYVVRFEKLTACEEVFWDTIVVKPSPDASFYYSGLIYCVGQTYLDPDTIHTYGGIFSYTADSVSHVLTLDIDSGGVDLINSSPGSYTINYLIPQNGAICSANFSQDLRILPQPTNVEMWSDKGDSICENTFVEFTGTGAELITWTLNGDTVGNGRTYEGVGLDSGDVVLAYFNTQQGCNDARSIVMHVFDRPEISVLPTPPILSGNDAIDIQVVMLTNETWVDWYVIGQGDLSFDSTSGRSPVKDSSETTSLGNVVLLNDPFNPATFTYTITPRNFLCTGDIVIDTFNVNPNDIEVFIPQVITPDNNTKNDVWEIQLKDGVDPANYTIKLFNSAGALVHTMNPLVRTFTGENADKGYLPDGVYWYLLFDNTGEKVDAGGLTIRRK